MSVQPAGAVPKVELPAPSASAPAPEQHPLLVLQSIKEAFDPSAAGYRFRHVFYNVVPPAEVARYQRPAGVDEATWQRACSQSPSPGCMVPVIASGADDLTKRAGAQADRIAQHRRRLAELGESAAALRTLHSVSTSARLLEMQRRHGALSQRALRILRGVQILPERGVPFSREDDELRSRLQELLVEQPAGPVQCAAAQGFADELAEPQLQRQIVQVLEGHAEVLSKTGSSLAEDSARLRDLSAAVAAAQT